MKVPSPLLEVDEGSEPMLEPIQGKFVTGNWHLEVLTLYEWVDRAMELLGRQFMSEESATKQRTVRREGDTRRDAKNPEGA
jgi:hypothetical protein